MGSKYAQYLYIYHWNCSPWKFVSLPVKFVRGIAVKTVNLHNESVNHTSVRDLLPENCLLNIDDGDFISLEGITDVDEQFFRHVFTGQEEELALDSESSDGNGEQSDHECSAGFDHRVEDQHDLQQTRQFIDDGCGCKLVEGI